MHEKLRNLMPTHDAVRENRWLKWIGPGLNHPWLWRMKRRSVAMGAGIGVFFAFIIPIAQIPLSAGAAVVLRANVPVAVLSTFVNTPLTFGPVYYAAWRVGCVMLGEEASSKEMPALDGAGQNSVPGEGAGGEKSWWVRAAQKVASIGKPMVVGAVTFAVGFGLLAYTTVLYGWRIKVEMKRQRRLRSRRR